MKTVKYVAIVALALALGGGIAVAIPDTFGVIHGCYSTATGTLRIVVRR